MTPTQTAPGWYPDPSGRHQIRYWDGVAWTDHVADNGVQGHDPPGGPPQAPRMGTSGTRPTRTTLDAVTIAANAAIIGLGVLLFADSFLDWLGLSATFGGTTYSSTANAWTFTLPTLAVVVGVLAAVPAIIRLCGIDVSPIFVLAMGGLAFLLVLIKVVAGPNIDTSALGVDVNKTREIGIFLGLVLTAGIAGAGLLQLLSPQRSSA